MSRENINNIIKELLEELKMKFPDFKGLYLFGSYARGNANEDSDIDIALVFDRKIDWKFKDEVSALVWLEMIKREQIIDSFTICENELIKPRTPFKENIKKEGIFYGA